MSTDGKKVKLIKFGGLGCPACKAMDRARVFDRLADELPALEVVKFDVNDAEGETPAGSSFAEAYDLSDEYEVEMLPTMIFEDIETGDELNRVEGAVNFKDLRKAADEAFEEYTALRSRRELSKKAGAARR